MKSPYPYFGGKSSVAYIIWEKFGNIENYVEPFCGSLAVLLANPNIPKIETINDKDCFVTNFWRSIANDPEKVTKFADYPVSEVDLHARQKYCLSKYPELLDKMENDYTYYDAELAGYWVWRNVLFNRK